MAYLSFDAGETSVLVEVAPQEAASTPGMIKAGVGERLKEGIAQAQVGFADALTRLIDLNAGAFVRAVKRLKDVPDEIEVEFSIKATGELGNFAVGKLSGDANYSVRLTWRGLVSAEPDDTG